MCELAAGVGEVESWGFVLCERMYLSPSSRIPEKQDSLAEANVLQFKTSDFGGKELGTESDCCF